MPDVPKDQPAHRQTATDESRSGAIVPEGTEWEVITQIPYDSSENGGLTTTIIYAVAEAEGVPTSEIKHPPLYDVVDTSALETALFGSESRIQASECSTEFMYRGYRIVVRTDGWVRVHEPVE